MRIAVLSAGPSLRTTWMGGDYAATIGINYAIEAAEVDWLVAGDACHLIEHLTRKPKRGIWTMVDDLDRIAAVWPDVPVCKFTGLPGLVDLPRSWTWSSQAALAVALHLGAREVDIYGVDMTDAPDAAGRHPGYRCAERWERESRDLADSISLLKSYGVLVRRVTPFPWEKT